MVSEAVQTHCWVVGFVLLGAVLVLRANGRFTLGNLTVWFLAAFGLYFLVHPAVSLWLDDGMEYEIVAQLTGGIARVRLGIWAAALGIVGYVLGAEWLGAQLTRGRLGAIARPARTRPTAIQWFVLGLFGVLAIYCLIVYRGAFGMARAAREIDSQGRFVGSVTGYQVVMYKMGLVPLFVGLLLPRWRNTFLGLTALYILARLFDPWDRASVVAVFVTMLFVIVGEVRQPGDGLARAQRWVGATSERLRGGISAGRRWLAIVGVGVALVCVAVVLQIRGHKSIDELSPLRASEVDVGHLLSGKDTGMLPSFYIKSWIYERKGKTYGGIVLARAAFGFLPRRWFPWKDEIAEVVAPERRQYVVGEELGYHIKDSLVGTMYRIGGLWFVPLGMFLVGFAGRLLELLVRRAESVLWIATGYCWMGMWWMVVGSSIEWSLNVLFVIALPSIVASATRLVVKGVSIG